MPLPIALKHMTLVDGTGRPPLENALLVLRDGRIDAVGDAAKWQSDEPMTTLDLSGHTVLPGLIDCHVHLAMDGPADSKLHGETAWTTLLMLKHAQNNLAAGFTTVRDVGGRYGLEFSVRRAIEQSLWAGPRMQLAGKLLSITSAGAAHYDGMYREADGVDEVRKAAREQLKAGADLIKVLATGAVLAPPSFFGIPLLFTPPRFGGLVDSSLRPSPGQFIVLNLLYQPSRAFTQRLF